MKTLLTIFTLVFTVMFSSTSFAGWTKVGENVNGHTYYVDFETAPFDHSGTSPLIGSQEAGASRARGQ